MDDQQRAMEFLAQEYDYFLRPKQANSIRTGLDSTDQTAAALRAITAALRAAPEGFVLVPVEPTDELTLRIAKALQASEQLGWTWEDCSPIEVEGWMELATAAIAAMLSARQQGVKDVD